jgi:hypothetical protein
VITELVNDDSYSDAEVMLSRIEDPGWVVVELNSPNVQLQNTSWVPLKVTDTKTSVRTSILERMPFCDTF